MPAMAFDVGFRQVVVEEGVVFEVCQRELRGIEVEHSLENAKGFVLCEQPDRNEIADLQDEALRLLDEHPLGFVDLLPEGENLFPGGELLNQFAECLPRVFRKHRECPGEFVRSLKSSVEHDVINR